MTSEIPLVETAAAADAVGSGRRATAAMMERLRITQLGEPVLTTPTQPFELPREREEVNRIVTELVRVAIEVERCHDFGEGGMGLAAPQISIGRSVAIFRPGGGDQVVLINPTIVSCEPESPAEWAEASEGCLSFFDIRCWVPRPQRIVVTYQEYDGTAVTRTFAAGRQARDVMHEIDHLAGVLCTARMRVNGRIQEIIS